MLVDLSLPMLERAARNIASAGGAGDDVPQHVRLVQADLFSLPSPPDPYTTILGLGLTHLVDDIPALVAALGAQLGPGGRLHLAGLVAQTARGRRYLGILHRAGEVATPKTAEELFDALQRPAHFTTVGCMAYATITAT